LLPDELVLVESEADVEPEAPADGLSVDDEADDEFDGLSLLVFSVLLDDELDLAAGSSDEDDC
jgi:hypothetical protein